MPTDRELHFSSSLSTGAGAQQAQQQQQPQQFLLPAVPEEEQQLPVAEAGGPEEAAPSVTQSAGAGGGGGGGARSAAPTPASVPAPPRELAITALTGLEATPLRGGFYQYTDTRTGYTFQLGPASPDSAGGCPSPCCQPRLACHHCHAPPLPACHQLGVFMVSRLPALLLSRQPLAELNLVAPARCPQFCIASCPDSPVGCTLPVSVRVQAWGQTLMRSRGPRLSCATASSAWAPRGRCCPAT